MKEEWRAVVGWEGLYEVSDRGRVRSLDRYREFANRWGGMNRAFCSGRILKLVAGQGNSGRGIGGHYHAVCLSGYGKFQKVMVHRLVLTAFVGPDPGCLDGAHANGETTDNRLENLRWATRRENMADMPGQGRKSRGNRFRYSPYSLPVVLAIREAAELGLSATAIRLIGKHRLSKSSLNKILNDTDWLERNFGLACAVGRRAATAA